MFWEKASLVSQAGWLNIVHEWRAPMLPLHRNCSNAARNSSTARWISQLMCITERVCDLRTYICGSITTHHLRQHNLLIVHRDPVPFPCDRSSTAGRASLSFCQPKQNKKP